MNGDGLDHLFQPPYDHYPPYQYDFYPPRGNQQPEPPSSSAQQESPPSPSPPHYIPPAPATQQDPQGQQQQQQEQQQPSLPHQTPQPTPPAQNDQAAPPLDEEPLYVNAKQYYRILKRRVARARLEEVHRLSRSRKPYLHESRHKHAMRRPRGPGGRFLTAEEIAAQKAMQENPRNGDDDGDGDGELDQDHEMSIPSPSDPFPEPATTQPQAGPSSHHQSVALQPPPGSQGPLPSQQSVRPPHMPPFSPSLSMVDFQLSRSQPQTPNAYPPPPAQQHPPQPGQQSSGPITLHQPHAQTPMSSANGLVHSTSVTPQHVHVPSSSPPPSAGSHSMHHHAHPRPHHQVFIPPASQAQFVQGSSPSPVPGVLRSPFNAMQMHHVPHPHAHARHHISRLNRQEGLYGPAGDA